MQEEVTQKTIALVVRTAKLDERPGMKRESRTGGNLPQGSGASCGTPQEKSRLAESKAGAKESGTAGGRRRTAGERLSHTDRIKAHHGNVYNWP